MAAIPASRRAVMGGLLALPGLTVAEAAAQGALPGGERVTFLHVNDIYQHAPQGGRGGLAELRTLLDRARAAAPGPVVFTFGGDLFSPSLASSITKGRHMVALFNELAPAAAVLGNHEFDFGPEVAEANIRASTFPWLGANVLGRDGQPFGGCVASVMHEPAPGLKIGFVGVLTPATAVLSNPAGITFTPPEAALRGGAAALRAAGATLVVGLTHLNLEEDRRLAADNLGLDLILGAHDHDPISILESGPLIVKAGQDAHWLAAVEMEVNRAAAPGRRVASLGWRFVPNIGVPPEPRLGAAVAAIEATLDQALSRPLARLDAPLDSRTAVVRTRETAIGNLMADALRGHFSADVALINGGALRGNREYPAGHEFTRRDLLTEMPFGNSVVLVELTGAELLGVLENGVSMAEEPSGRFPQLSGVSLVYEPRDPAGSRLREVMVGGAALEPGRVYRLATIDFLTRGGDGYAGLRAARVVVDSAGGPLIVNVIAEAIERAGGIAARVEGRVRAAR